jgi:HAD superfamily hydrolase (TIGR01509 family)
MNDNSRRAGQWQRLVGEYFSTILGGSPEAWAEANRVVATAMFERDAWQARSAAAASYDDFERTYFSDWLGRMCEYVGAPQLPEEERVDLARRASAWIVPRTVAAFPGAVEAVRLLRDRGYRLHTASGTSSTDLEAYLGAMGVRHCFGRLYGPDLVDTLKSGPRYYERVFADAGVAPAEALVVDDNPNVLKWVRDLGAQPVLVDPAQDYGDADGLRVISSLAELPGLVEHIE